MVDKQPHGREGCLRERVKASKPRHYCTMPERFCRRDLVIAVSYEAMPVPGKYRSVCSQSSIGLNTGPPMKELEKISKELKGSAIL
jgi:hypothetical protein